VIIAKRKVVLVATMVTNLWAQYIYNNFITNYGRGTHYNSDSLINMFVFSLLGISAIMLYAIDLDTKII